MRRRGLLAFAHSIIQDAKSDKLGLWCGGGITKRKGRNSHAVKRRVVYRTRSR